MLGSTTASGLPAMSLRAPSHVRASRADRREKKACLASIFDLAANATPTCSYQSSIAHRSCTQRYTSVCTAFGSGVPTLLDRPASSRSVLNRRSNARRCKCSMTLDRLVRNVAGTVWHSWYDLWNSATRAQNNGHAPARLGGNSSCSWLTVDTKCRRSVSRHANSSRCSCAQRRRLLNAASTPARGMRCSSC